MILQLRDLLRSVSVPGLLAAILSSVVDASAMEVGVAVHLGQGRATYAGIAPLLHALGTNRLRVELYWSDLERVPGQFEIDKAPVPVRDFLSGRSGDPSNSIVILGYGNPHYAGGGRPEQDTDIAAFSRYASALSGSYAAGAAYLELWNEWNLTTGVPGRSRGDAPGYAHLASAVIPALRRTGYRGKLLIGGIGGDHPDWAFTRALTQSELLGKADGYSVHLYNFARQGDPSEMLGRLDRLQSILTTKNGGKPYPVYVTEVGWPTHMGQGGVSEQRASNYLASFLIGAAGRGWVHGVWIYELIDGGDQAGNPEHRFGLFRRNGEPKEGHCLVRSSIRLAERGRPLKYGTISGIAWSTFALGNDTVHVLYTTGNRPPQRILRIRPRTSQAFSVSSLCHLEDERQAQLASGSAMIKPVDLPVIVKVRGHGAGKNFLSDFVVE